VAVHGLIFIGLVAVAGFSVMAQRRLRALGMLSAIGATERNVRLVMTTNGLLVGVAAALAGAVLGFAAWFAYAPVLPEDTGHVVDAANLPWWAIAAGIVLAIGTSVLASLRPAVTMARTPVVAALSGRPAAPRALRRSAGPGVIVFAAGVAFLVLAGGPSGQRRHASVLLLAGLVAVIAGIFLLAPLSATTFALFLAMLICVVTSIKAENPLDWMGPNLSSSQLIVYVQPQIGGGFVKGQTSAQLAGLGRQVDSYAAGLHAPPALPLDVTGASLFQAGTNQPGTAHFTGTLYVATPRLLAMYGIKASQIGQDTDILTEVPGLAGLPHLRMTWASSGGGPLGGGSLSCTPSNDCLLSPVIQTIPGLPGGTSAPNTLITESAVSRYHLTLSLNGWLIQAPGPLTSAQISAARQLALAYGVTVETTSGSVSLGEITDGVTALGIVIALGVLAMSVGLIRSETARDLRTLTAAGASARTRRTTISGGTLTTDMARQPLD
jgi:putative ABC transport system permease protein